MTSVMMSGGKVKMRGGKVRVGAAGDPCCCGGETLYRQARNCEDDSLADVWMTTTSAALFPNAFSLDFCYYFNFADATSASPGTVYPAAAATPAVNCDGCPGDCWDGVCDGTTAYAVDFSGTWDLPYGTTPTNSPCSDTALFANAPTAMPLVFNPSPILGVPCLFSPYGYSVATPVYIASASTPGSTININPNGSLALYPQLDTFYPGGCNIWVIQITFDAVLGSGGGGQAIYYGPRNANAAGVYTLSTHVGSDPTAACMIGHLPPTITVT